MFVTQVFELEQRVVLPGQRQVLQRSVNWPFTGEPQEPPTTEVGAVQPPQG